MPESYIRVEMTETDGRLSAVVRGRSRTDAELARAMVARMAAGREVEVTELPAEVGMRWPVWLRWLIAAVSAGLLVVALYAAVR